MTDINIPDDLPPWIKEHISIYLKDGEAGHLWDSSIAGGPGPIPTLLLFTTGRKSGQESIMPLIYGAVGDAYAIIASKGGAPKHPGWFHNLMAQDQVKLKGKNDVFQATTRIATGDERAKVWDQLAAIYPPFNDYKVAAGSREIPVVMLEKA